MGSFSHDGGRRLFPEETWDGAPLLPVDLPWERLGLEAGYEAWSL